jgi:CRISPR-associated endonuclease Cas1
MTTDTHPTLDLSIWEDLTPDPSIWIIDGPSPRMYVTGGTRDKRTRKITGQSLCIIDGPKRDDPRTRYVHDTDKIVKHVVILSAHGSPSLDAIRFLADMGITWAIIDMSTGAPRVMGTSSQNIDAKLLRLQAMAAPDFPLEWTGVQIIRELTSLKLEGQAFNAEYVLHNLPLAKAIRNQIDGALTVERPTAKDTLASIMGYEGTGADAYWTAWKGIAPVWHRITTVLKPNWLSYPGRKSLRRSETNRRATDPVNAALNYGYGVAESWCIIALLSAGLDPRMGIQHVDMSGRSSFALDLIEVVRPYVDEIVLDIFLTGRLNGNGSVRLDPRMFWSKPEGLVMVSQPLTGVIAQRVGQRCQEHLTPVVTRIRELLSNAVMS